MSTPNMDDAELLRLAVAELIGETTKANLRYSSDGPSGWKPCPVKTNKTFLTNTLLQTLSTNREIDRKRAKLPPPKRRDRKLLQPKTATTSHNLKFKKPTVTKKPLADRELSKKTTKSVKNRSTNYVRSKTSKSSSKSKT